MSHRLLLLTPLLLGGLACKTFQPQAVGSSGPPSSAPDDRSRADKRPNILFILADDQSPFDLRLYNPRSRLETPVLDTLAAEGMVIDGAHHMGSWSGAVCSPSRHMIMSGRTVWHLPGGHPNGKDATKVPSDLPERTLAAVFNQAGYDTMRTCKEGNSYDAANAKFTVSRTATKRGGDDRDGSAWHADQALSFLEQRKAGGARKPFLIYLGFSHPHDPRPGKPALLTKYGSVNHDDQSAPPELNPKSPALPVNYLQAHPFHHGHPNLRDEVAVNGVWTRRDEATVRNELGRQFACSENIDQQIGRVLKRLKELGELDNTYVVYTSDHGIAIGRHGLMGKQNLYEHSWRVPFVVRGPGIKPGTRAKGNIYLLDTLATLCDLAGIEPPRTNEGISFKPVLEGHKAVIRDVLYGVYSGGTKPGMRAIKRDNFKLIKYDVNGGQVRETQLFDLAKNPYELLQAHHDPAIIQQTGLQPSAEQTDLAEDPRYAPIRRELEALLQKTQTELDDPYKLWDQSG